jgi:hypothetical protein
MEKEKFRCDLCDVIYTTNIKLINHKKKIHNIENDLKYFNCKFCGKSFHNKPNLYKHHNICKKNIPVTNKIQNNNLIESNINNEQTELKNNDFDKLKLLFNNIVEPINNNLINIIVNKSNKINELEFKINNINNINDINDIKYENNNYINSCIKNNNKYINIKKICEIENKNFNDWLELDVTKELINNMHLSLEELIYYENDNIWVHTDIILSVALWISNKVYIEINNYLKNNISEKYNKIIETKEENIKLLNNIYIKKQKRENYKDNFVIYILTTEDSQKKKIYIIGKASILKNRLSTYNKTCEHIVVYYKSCGNKQNMDVIELMILNKLYNYKEQVNRDRFILPDYKDISFFINVVDECINFIIKPI